MKFIFQFFKPRNLYIFFLFLALNLSFFSTNNVNGEGFFVDEIEIVEKLENNFNKDILINRGFKKAFRKLMNNLVQSKDLNKVKNINLNEIKGMIETFSIKEEKFINKTYNLNLSVLFDRKKIFDYLENKNIFPTQIIREKFLFLPIFIDQFDNSLLVYSNNPIYKNWATDIDKNNLIQYILPSEDLEDLELIRKYYLDLEDYNFEEIIEKYFLDNSIIALFSKDQDKIKVLSKIKIQDKKFIQNNLFKNIDLNNSTDLNKLIHDLKIIYEDFWKQNNLINTSIKLPLMIKVDNENFDLSSKFERTLAKIDLINNYSIISFNKDFIVYEVIFNGGPQNFLKIMKEKNFTFNTEKKIWILNE